MIEAQYEQIVKFEGYFAGTERTKTAQSSTPRITLPSGHKWRITIDDIHFCHGHDANHGLGAGFTIGGTGISILNRYITDDNRSTLVKVPSEILTKICVDSTIGKDTQNSFWPKSFSTYDSGNLWYWASSGEIGPDASLGSPGVQFIYETDTVTSETTLWINMSAEAYKSSGCKTDTSLGSCCNAHYLVEPID